MKPQVVVVPHFRHMDEIFDAGTLARLHEAADVIWGRDEPMPPDDFAAALETATAVVFGTWHYGRAAVPAAGERLRFIFEVAGGHSHRDLNYQACFERGVAVGSCSPAFGPAVAEMALALALAAGRLVNAGDAAFRAGKEKWLHDGTVGAVTMWNKTIGFVGAGGLSRSLQKIVAGFDVDFLAYDPWQDPTTLRRRGLEPVELGELMVRCDFIFVLAVPTPDNYHLITRELMELLRPHQTLAVISRAHLVDFEAMTDMLLAGRFRAAIDVFPTEPFEADHRIRRVPNAVFSAHRAGAIPEALQEIGRMVVDDLEDLLAGGRGGRLQYATPEMIAALQGE